MNKTVKQAALFLLIGLLILAVFQFNRDSGSLNTISYSDFIRQVSNGEIGKIIIENNRKISGVYNEKSPRYTEKKKETSPFGITGAEYDFQTFIPYADHGLIDLLLSKNVPVEGMDDSDNVWYNGLISFLPWLVIFGFIWFIMIRQLSASGNKAFTFGKSRAKLNPVLKTKVTFDDVAGVDEAKVELREIIEFLKDPKKFINMGARIPTGVLLSGPPGTGKTLLAKAVAGEAGVPFFSISGSDFVEMFVGVGASRVRDLFEQGKRSAPCIIFIDEIDAVGRLRGAGLGGGHDEREQTLNQLLVEMDGFETNEGVIVVAATNRPDVLDPALLRPGRFDRQVIVDAPDLKGREKVLAVHTKKVPLARDVDLKIIARGTPGFTGADLANLVNEGAILAARKNKKRVSMAEMEEAKDKVLMGPERRSMLISDSEKKIIAYHEAGHAVLGLLIGEENVHKVTIIPRGMALGLTMNLPVEDKHINTKEYWLNQIKMLFGGRIAELLVFNQMSTGASNDIERASAIARRMVCEWGMSEKLGPLNFGRKNEQIFLGREISQHRDFSESTAEQIDEEVRSIIDECHSQAVQMIKDNYDRFTAIAQNLLERETLDAEEIALIMKGEQLPPVSGEAVSSDDSVTAELKTESSAE